MSNANKHKIELGIWIDIPYFLRLVYRFLIPIVSAAIIAGSVAYIGADRVLSNQYTATAIISVIPRQNTPNALSERTFNSAVSTHISMLTSKVLRQSIQDANPEQKVDGSLGARDVPGTGLVYVSAVADSAEEAYFLLTQAINLSSEVDDQFDNDYYRVVLTRTPGTSIRVERKKPILYAALAMGLAAFGLMGLLGIFSIFTDLLHEEGQAKELLAVRLFDSLPVMSKKKRKKNLLITDSNITMGYVEAMNRFTSQIDNHMSFRQRKTLMVTSVSPNEGKTTVITNLAINLVRRGKRVLLIDLDLRNPSVAKQLRVEVPELYDLSETIRNSLSIQKSIIRHPEMDTFDLILQSHGIGRSDQLLENYPFQTEFEKLGKVYDYILLDTPPMGPVRDSEVIAGFTDAAVIVFAQDMTRGPVVNDVCDALEDAGTRCIGAIMNHRRTLFARRSVNSVGREQDTRTGKEAL